MNASLPTLPVAINRQRLVDRFLRYVRVDTTADPSTTSYPSSEGQRDLGTLIRAELDAMGLSDVLQDDHGLVYATIPASVDRPATVATIALVAHLDTSPEASGRDVRPVVIEQFDGQPVTLESGEVVDPSAVHPRDDWAGKTLIFTDGTTLLGGDDKAGVAIMIELAETLLENRHVPHGPIQLIFTCDEEIGRGTDKIDVQKLGAVAAYTIDGGGRGVIDVETFSADAATVIFRGRNIHPSVAKGEMINSVRAAADFVASLPRHDQTPETTSDRDGFIHPHDIVGGVSETTVELILRSFDEAELADLGQVVRDAADAVCRSEDHRCGTGDATRQLTSEVQIRRQYRNMSQAIAECPEVVQFAETAMTRLGRSMRREIIRGGTDGSQLSEKGLPTPNLSSGQYNIHSTGEFVCVDDMVEAIEHLVVLAGVWSESTAV